MVVTKWVKVEYYNSVLYDQLQNTYEEMRHLFHFAMGSRWPKVR